MENKSRPAFTVFEKEYLRELIAPFINILESKKTNASFNKEKEEIWNKIAVEFNNCSRCVHAFPKQLKKAWNNMKTRAREAKTIIQQRKHTGGGPSIDDMNPEDDSVISLLPHVLPKIKVVKDSDGVGDNDSNADDDSDYWMRKINRTKSFVTPSAPNEEVQYEIIFPPVETEMINAEPDTSLTERSTNQNDKQRKDTQTSSNQPTAKPNLKRGHRTVATGHSLEQLKMKIIENDLKNREIKFELEIAHLKKIQNIQENIFLVELEHKKRLLEMAEEEHKLKLCKLKKD